MKFNKIMIIASLMFAKIISIMAKGNTCTCIPLSQGFVTVDRTDPLRFEDFDFPIVELHLVKEYLRGLGIVHMENLPNKYLCEKGCSLHVACRAFKYDPTTGCYFGVNEIQPEMGIGLWQFINGVNIEIGMFRDFISGNPSFEFHQFSCVMARLHLLFVSFL